MTDYTEIGTIIKPHGLKGHVAVHVEDYALRGFNQFEQIYLELMGSYVPYAMDEVASLSKGKFKVKLTGIDSVEMAELMRGHTVFQETGLLGLEQQVDLAGYKLIDPRGEAIGEVKTVIQSPMQVLLLVSKDGKEFYVPLVREYIVSADTAKKRMVLDLPGGLEDL